jgi:glycosyltransferase involved in cell wall biosynthesis
VDGFVAAGEKLVDSPELRADMGERARRYALETFDIKAVADRFEDVIIALHGRVERSSRWTRTD